MSLLRRMLAGLGAAALLAGCSNSAGGPGEEPGGQLVNDATFRLALAFDPGALDPAINIGMGRQFPPFVYDSLVASTPDNELVGNLASEWEEHPDRVIFTIRDDVTCADGSDVTASVIAESFAFLQTEQAQARPFGDVSDWEVVGDDEQRTVTFTFGEPVGFPVAMLAYTPVVCGEGLRDRSLLTQGTSGSGPYVLTELVPNDRYILERREDYAWGPGGVTAAEPGLPKTIVLRVVTDPSTTANMLLAGDLDGAGLPEAARERVGEQARVLSVPNELGQLMFNNASGRVTAEADVRRALTMAVDRAALAAVAKGPLAHNMSFPLTNPCPEPANEEAIPAHDPAAAEALLESAGWERGPDGVRAKDGERLVIDAFTVNDFSAEFEAAATLAAQAWREIGFDVGQRSVTGAAALQTIVSGDWDVAPMSALGSLTPAQLTGVVSGAAPPEGSNLARIDNPEYRRFVGQALRAESLEEACAAWNAAERALYSEANIIPVVAGNRHYAMARHIDFAANMAGVVPTSVRVHGD